MRGIALRVVVLGLAAAGAASAVAFPLLRGPQAPPAEALPSVPAARAPAVTVVQGAPGHSLAGPRPIPSAHPTAPRPQPSPRAVPTAPAPTSGMPVARRSTPSAAEPQPSAKPRRAEKRRTGDSVGLPAAVERDDLVPAEPPRERHTKE
jgi:hypothetical protein